MADHGSEVAQEADRFLAACREAFQRAMPSLFDHLFSRLDNVLYDFADKSESTRLYTTYFDAMQVFRRRRQEILSLFLRNLLEDGATFPVARFSPRARPVRRAGSATVAPAPATCARAGALPARARNLHGGAPGPGGFRR